MVCPTILIRMPDGLPPPYPEIYEAFIAGTVIPFLGAGAPLFDRDPKRTPWFRRDQGKRCGGSRAARTREH